jgi:hypothetical protein
MSNPRLKPCPFCGRDVTLEPSPTEIPTGIWHQVRCECGVRGPIFFDLAHLAVQGWNKICRKEG